jgi:hypothetical protein
MTAVRLRNVNRPTPHLAIIHYYVGRLDPEVCCHPDPTIHSEKRKSGFDAERTGLGQNRLKNGA